MYTIRIAYFTEAHMLLYLSDNIGLFLRMSAASVIFTSTVGRDWLHVLPVSFYKWMPSFQFDYHFAVCHREIISIQQGGPHSVSRLVAEWSVSARPRPTSPLLDDIAPSLLQLDDMRTTTLSGRCPAAPST